MENDQSGLTVIYRAIDDLKPYKNNARTHSKKQINQIAESIRVFGYTNPVLIDQNDIIIAGHGRVMAAKSLGHNRVPCILIGFMTEDQKRAYILADNKLAEKAGWDKAILSIELQHLLSIETDLNISLTGFSDLEIEDLVHGDIDNDDDNKLPKTDDGRPATTRLGDCWLLGEHRLFCGDATKQADVDALMSGKRATMAFTDPPYNVSYVAQSKKKKHRPILNDAIGEDFEAFLTAACRTLLSVTDGATYVCMSSSELSNLQSAFQAAGGHWSTFLIWAKNHFTLGRSDYQRQYEPILYGWREGTERRWCGARDQGDVWFFDKPAHSDLHPTMKPVGLVMRAIRNSSEKGDIVLDIFLGSGTTLIAAERTGRICYGLELDPRYVDTAILRWQRHTGRQAVHAVTRQPFTQTAKPQAGDHGQAP